MSAHNIRGEITQSRTGKQITYWVEYERQGASTVAWSGRILAEGGKRHELEGGKILNVAERDTVDTVTMHLHTALDGLDLEALDA